MGGVPCCARVAARKSARPVRRTSSVRCSTGSGAARENRPPDRARWRSRWRDRWSRRRAWWGAWRPWKLIRGYASRPGELYAQHFSICPIRDSERDARYFVCSQATDRSLNAAMVPLLVDESSSGRRSCPKRQDCDRAARWRSAHFPDTPPPTKSSRTD